MQREPRRARIVVDLRGGLANQLFQWASAELLAEEFDAQIVYDARTIDRPHNRGSQLGALGLAPVVRDQNALGRASWRGFHAVASPRVMTVSSHYLRPANWRRTVDNLVDARHELSHRGSVWIAGYMEETSEIVGHRDELRSRLVQALRLVARPAPEGDYGIVHVRRGDYVSDPLATAKFGLCSIEFYVSAIEALDSEIVYVVTDDGPWAEAQLQPRTSRRIEVLNGGTHFDDLLALTQGAEVVMSNSTFSWWGVFAGRAGRVVCPKPWDADDRQHFFDDGWEFLDKVDGHLVA